MIFARLQMLIFAWKACYLGKLFLAAETDFLIGRRKITWPFYVGGRPEWGEIVVAYVVGDAKADELDTLCLGSIARFKRPKDYVFVDSLPTNNYGKILKADLRERDRDGDHDRR